MYRHYNEIVQHVPYTLYNTYIVYNTQCILYTVYYTLYNIQCIMYMYNV